MLADLDPEMVPPPSSERIAQSGAVVGERDSHVLAGPLGCRASYLLTLDRRHLITPAVQAARLPLKVVTPGDFLEETISEQPP